jgi:hypothetical protein
MRIQPASQFVMQIDANGDDDEMKTHNTIISSTGEGAGAAHMRVGICSAM